MPALENVKHERFCQEYIIDLNQTQAAVRADFSVKTASSQASRLLTRVNIQERVQELFDERAKRVEIDADWVLSSALKLHKKCIQEEKIKDADGNDITGLFDSSGANKSLELIGKHTSIKCFSDKVDLTGEGITFNMKFTSDKK